MPSKPGYEPLSQAKPSRHPEVAGYQPDPAARLAACRIRAPPTEITASPPQTGTWRHSGSARSPSRAKPRSCPPPGRRTARGFRRLDKWHTGSEGRISYLKRRYGWDRTRLDGRGGAAIWCAHGDFARNLVKLSALAS